MPSRLRRLALLTVLLASAPSLRAQERALAPLEVRPSPAFEAAVAAGTRSLDPERLFADVDASDDVWTP